MKVNEMMIALIGMVSLSVLADVSVYDVKCQPRTPWNGLVDVSYTVACDDPEADIYINPVAYDGDRRLTLFPSQFTGDGATNTVKAGKHTMVWDAFKDFGAFSSANFQLKIYAGKRLPRYVWVDLSSGSDSTNYPVHYSVTGPDLSNNDCRTKQLWLRLVPPGEFWMGSPEDELGRGDDEILHHVTLTKPFYIGVFEFTQRQWELIMGDNPSYFYNATNSAVRPVEKVKYNYGAYSYYYSSGVYSFSGISEGSQIRGLRNPQSRSGYHQSGIISKLCIRTQNGGWELPTEAQWEYACRAGTTAALNNGKNLTDKTWSQTLGEVAAYYGNVYAGQSYNQSSINVGTQTVGSYAPNALGLYDMLGNVWEYCRDGGTKTYDGLDEVDPLPIGTYTLSNDGRGRYRLKGGCWKYVAKYCRSGETGQYNIEIDCYDDIGFRIVCLEGF